MKKSRISMRDFLYINTQKQGLEDLRPVSIRPLTGGPM